MAFAYRPLQPGEEPALFPIVDHALNIGGIPWEPFVERIGRENLRVVHRFGRPVGGLGMYRMGQWFGGRVVSCAGVSAVAIAPAERGQGAARFALASLLEELHADATPLACLYPSTDRLYRGVGFEQAGSYCRYELPLLSIGINDRSLPVTHVEELAPERFLPVANVRGRLTNGNLDRTPGLWRRILRFREAPTYNCLIGDPADPQGFVCYQNETQGEQARLRIIDMAAVSPATARRLWTFLSDHRSIFRTVGWTGPPTEPLLGLIEQCHRIPVQSLRWMLRIVNVPAALEARGYLSDLEGELHLDVTDELLRENTGRLVLSVSGGRGYVTVGGRGDLRLGVRGLAPLYSSFLGAEALRSIGWLEGDDAAVAMATRLFTGPEPWMAEIF